MRKLLFANWKMYLSDADAVALAGLFVEGSRMAALDVAVAPGFTALRDVARALGGSDVALGAQDGSAEDAGAFTGEISMRQLADLGARYVLVGHSERRAMGELDALVARKMSAAAEAGLTPVLCVGELAEERAVGRQEDVVRTQLRAALEALPPSAPFLVAYEPRWAIGTGTPCAPSDVTVMHAFLRSLTSAPILYGGSVTPANARDYLSLPDVDGLLVGAASTRPADVRAFFEAFSS